MAGWAKHNVVEPQAFYTGVLGVTTDSESGAAQVNGDSQQGHRTTGHYCPKIFVFLLNLSAAVAHLYILLCLYV